MAFKILQDSKVFVQDLAKVVCHPICSDKGDLEAVLELIRTNGMGFTEDDVEVILKSEINSFPKHIFHQIVNSYLIWGGIALHYADQICKVQEEKYVRDFFASIVRYISGRKRKSTTSMF